MPGIMNQAREFGAEAHKPLAQDDDQDGRCLGGRRRLGHHRDRPGSA
jgi:hypothetical protein